MTENLKIRQSMDKFGHSHEHQGSKKERRNNYILQGIDVQEKQNPSKLRPVNWFVACDQLPRLETCYQIFDLFDSCRGIPY